MKQQAFDPYLWKGPAVVKTTFVCFVISFNAERSLPSAIKILQLIPRFFDRSSSFFGFFPQSPKPNQNSFLLDTLHTGPRKPAPINYNIKPFFIIPPAQLLAFATGTLKGSSLHNVNQYCYKN